MPSLTSVERVHVGSEPEPKAAGLCAASSFRFGRSRAQPVLWPPSEYQRCRQKKRKYQRLTWLVANYLDRMCSTFFDIAGSVSCFDGRRLSHENMSAKRWESTLSSKFHCALVSRTVFRACVFDLDIIETSPLEVGHSFRWGDEMGSASII